ncbi:MAG: choice-of-anchor V domain-containing protein [Saprospiraceae bacterium]
MKLRIIYTLFTLMVGAFLFLSNAGGRATATSEGNTGAPNDNGSGNRTCQTCHNNGSFAVTPTLEITDAAGTVITDNFNPGETYNVKMTIDATNTPAGYGFQIVALNAANGSDGTAVNTWANPSANVQIATLGTGRQYAEQSALSSSNEFTMEWTAPADGTVTFYYGGNATDDNGNTSGDNAVMGSMSLDSNPDALNELERILALDIFPNPVSDVLNLRTNAQTTDTYDLQLFDQNGKQISTERLMIPSGENVAPIDVANLPTGIYNLILSDGKNQIAKKMLKL